MGKNNSLAEDAGKLMKAIIMPMFHGHKFSSAEVTNAWDIIYELEGKGLIDSQTTKTGSYFLRDNPGGSLIFLTPAFTEISFLSLEFAKLCKSLHPSHARYQGLSPQILQVVE